MRPGWGRAPAFIRVGSPCVVPGSPATALVGGRTRIPCGLTQSFLPAVGRVAGVAGRRGSAHDADHSPRRPSDRTRHPLRG